MTDPDISFLGDTPLDRLKALMARLRSEDNGCPWDSEQTFETIAPYTIEEAYEVSEAINQKDMVALKEELGDLMFQVIFHSRMAEEMGEFDVEEVADALTAKMVRRHPHIFGEGDDRSAAEQIIAWEEQKAHERAQKGKGESILDDVAQALPALMRAEKLQKRAARVGFDWPNLDGVIEKITEEAQEFADAAKDNDTDALEDEMGDLLFAVTNLARKTGIDPEKALRRTNHKFISRFQYIENKARATKRDMDSLSIEEMEMFWTEAKNN